MVLYYYLNARLEVDTIHSWRNSSIFFSIFPVQRLNLKIISKLLVDEHSTILLLLLLFEVVVFIVHLLHHSQTEYILDSINPSINPSMHVLSQCYTFQEDIKKIKSNWKMNVFNLMQFLFITAFLTPILRFIYLWFLDSVLLEWILKAIRTMKMRRMESKSNNSVSSSSR